MAVVETGGVPRRDGTGTDANDTLATLAFFSTWTVIGLFVDGWAHNTGRPEDFFTPWHALLYSGFVLGVGYFVLREVFGGRTAAPVDRLVSLGVGGFAAGAAGDGVWHTIFGVENDVEALLSPTHLLLMVSGLAIVSAPARAWRDQAPTGMASFLPAVVSVTLSLSIVAFFLQFASTQRVFDEAVFHGGVDDELRITGVVSVLITNAIVLGAVAWTSRTWPWTPAGTYTVVLGGTGLLLSVLDGFEQAPLLVPLALAGVVADVLVQRRASTRTILLAVPAVLWPVWFLAYDLHLGLGWEAEMWTGSVFLAVLCGFGIDLVGRARTE